MSHSLLSHDPNLIADLGTTQKLLSYQFVHAVFRNQDMSRHVVGGDRVWVESDICSKGRTAEHISKLHDANPNGPVARD
jgi:hypothetical protein